MRKVVKNFRKLYRGVASSAIAIGLIASLTGCLSLGPTGGQTKAEAVTMLEQTPGVASVKLEDKLFSYSGLQPNYDLTVTIGMESGWTINEDTGATVDWLFRTLWSLRDAHKAGGLGVAFYTALGEELGHDFSKAEELLGPGPFLKSTGYAGFNRNEGHELYGDWPGAIPETPEAPFVFDPERAAAEQVEALERPKLF